MMMKMKMIVVMMMRMIVVTMMRMKMMKMIVPHVVVAGRASAPMVLVVVGFQLLIHKKGSP